MRISPSQIVVWRECNRKWGWKYLAKIKTDQNKSAALGSETHAQLENYLRGGSLDFTKPSGEIAQSGLEHLPPPLSLGMNLEGHFSFRSANHHEWHGFKDLELVPGQYGDIDVYDHKTTSDMKWAKTESQLETDPQAVIYAQDAFEKHPNARTVSLNWVYMQTRGARRSRRVHLNVLREPTVERFTELDLLANTVSAQKNAFESWDLARDSNWTHGTEEASEDGRQQTHVQVLKLPFDPTQCDAYGGCPYQNLCNLSPTERTGGRGLLFLTPVEDASMTTESESLFEKLMKQNAQSDCQLASSDAATTVTSEMTHPSKEEVVAVNPPESVFAVEPPATSTKPKKTAQKGKKSIENKDMTRVTGPASSDNADDDPATERAPASASDFKSEAMTLYVDCFPLSGAPLPAEYVFAEAKTRIHAQQGLADWRFAEYGKGGGILTQTVKEVLDEWLPNSLTLDSRTPEGSICMSSLVARAALTVRGR